MGTRYQCLALFWLPFLSVFLIGCGSQPRSTHPVLVQVLESDAELDCAGFDDELLKANALRDAIYEEHGDVILDTSLGSAVDIATEPISGVLIGILNAASTSKAAKRYIEAAAAAGLRMEQLLDYKERDNCPSSPTADRSLTDSRILKDLQELKSRLDQQAVNAKQYNSERRKLLDDL